MKKFAELLYLASRKQPDVVEMAELSDTEAEFVRVFRDKYYDTCSGDLRQMVNLMKFEIEADPYLATLVDKLQECEPYLVDAPTDIDDRLKVLRQLLELSLQNLELSHGTWFQFAEALSIIVRINMSATGLQAEPLLDLKAVQRIEDILYSFETPYKSADVSIFFEIAAEVWQLDDIRQWENL